MESSDQTTSPAPGMPATDQAVVNAGTETAEPDYPLRDPAEDARWAVRTVCIWIVFTVGFILFTVVMAILGYLYE